jgi:enoyl-CoA hydratase/carnithine racemase
MRFSVPQAFFELCPGEAGMADEVLKLERHDNFVTLTMNRAEKRNALNVALMKALDEAVSSIEGDNEIRAVIVRGAGSSFSSGLDLAEADRLEGGQGPVNIERVFHRLAHLTVPTIAAVQGAALAGGCELALHCDLRIAAEDLRMGMTVARVGLLVPYDFIRKPRRSSTQLNQLMRNEPSAWGWFMKSCPTENSTKLPSPGPRRYRPTRRSASVQ